MAIWQQVAAIDLVGYVVEKVLGTDIKHLVLASVQRVRKLFA